MWSQKEETLEKEKMKQRDLVHVSPALTRRCEYSVFQARMA
jgi:hypothetical protein